MTDQTARMRQLADTLNQASQAYYFGSEPIMSDMDWDKLYDELSALEKETGIVLPDSPTHRVGGEVMTAFAPHTHIHRLWSMDKAQSIGAWRIGFAAPRSSAGRTTCNTALSTNSTA